MRKKNFTEIVQRFVKNVNRRKKFWIYAKKKKRANDLDTVCFMLWAVVGAAIRDHWQISNIVTEQCLATSFPSIDAHDVIFCLCGI